MPESGEENSLSFNSDIAVDGASQVENINQKNILFPNPATDFITIDCKNNDINKIYIITNVSGQKIKTFKNYSDKIDISNLSKGIYFINFGKKHYKFIKK